MNVYVAPRGTEDVDMLTDALPSLAITSDRELMKQLGFRPTRSRTGSVLLLDHDDGSADLLVTKTPIQQYAVLKPEMHYVTGELVPVAAPDALGALKVEAISNNRERLKKDGVDIATLLLTGVTKVSEIESLLSDEQKIVLGEILAKFGSALR